MDCPQTQSLHRLKAQLLNRRQFLALGIAASALAAVPGCRYAKSLQPPFT